MDSRAFDGARPLQLEPGSELSLGRVVGGGIPCPKVDGGDFDGLVRNRVLDPQDPCRRVNFGGFGQLVEGLADNMESVSSEEG